MPSYMGFEYTAAPAEQVQPKYRVGDRVRVVDADGGGKVGDVGTVTSAEYVPEETEFYYQIIGLSRNATGLFGYRLQPAFRPGDRVKLNRHSGLRACGERGTVSSVIGDRISVRMDEPSVWGGIVAAFDADVLDWERDDEAAADCAGRKEQPKPKFKAGDVVKYEDEDISDGTFTITGVRQIGDGDSTSYNHSGGWDYEFSLELVTSAPCPQDNEQPCIVALIAKDGKPRPSSYPHVHASVAAATTEAERLARNNPGQEFAVYQRVAGRVGEVQMKEVA